MEEFKGLKVTHRNKFYKDGMKFHKTDKGEFLYYSDTYGKWMKSEFHANLIAL